MRLPSKIVFPFGYVVLIREISDQEMRLEVEAGQDEFPPDGLFDAETRTIFIRRGLSLGRKKYILSHEMIHLLADYQHEMLDEGIFKP